MPNTVTRMTAADLKKFSYTLSSFYPALYGTPAADVARKLNEQFFHTVDYVSDDMVEDDEYRTVAELYEDPDDPDRVSGYKVTLNGPVSEERLLDSGLDQTVNEQLAILEDGVKNNIYPEGSIARVEVDYMIDSLKRFQRRELVSDFQDNKSMSWIPAVGVNKKFADYVLVPKIPPVKKEENGRISYSLPEEFAADDPAIGFIPRQDQAKNARYTKEQLQESADKVNLAGFSKAAESFLDSLRVAENIGVMKDPDPAQEEIVRRNLITNIRYLRQELQKARHADPADMAARRMFGDKLGQMNGLLFSDRGFTEDINNLTLFENYLEAGLPLSGFKEYRAYYETAHNLTGTMDEIKAAGTGLGELTGAFDTLKERINTLPPKGANVASRDEWKKSLKEAMQGLKDAYSRINPADYQNAKGTIKTGIESTLRNKEIPNIEGYISNIDNMGKATVKEERRDLDHIMADMVRDMDRMSKEMGKRIKTERGLSEGLKKAINEVVKTGDVNNAYSPKRFEKALRDLAGEAHSAGNADLEKWAKKNAAHFGNRMKQAESKGVLPDESLNLQRRVNERENRIRFDQALRLFNTTRAKIFKSETKEHENARKAAESFQKAIKELQDLNGEKGSEKWKQKATEVMTIAGELSKQSFKYMNAKKFYADSPAGKDRLNGAIMLFREAEITRVMLKKQMAANERYQQLSAKTDELERSISNDPAITDEIGDANAAKMAEELQRVKQEEDRKKDQKERFDRVADPFQRTKSEVTRAGGRKFKETSFEELTRNMTLDENKREPVKRRASINVNSNEAPQPGAPRI
ncbi:MAG: hypothetical protein K6C95_06805 [Lachnospiraceae bacterium]|nr:hypothetical protein [Lachnospiraceae bacterium]